MSGSLLTLAIGPVQDFIATARRTRDLWFGSYLLSELSKAAALAVHNEGGRLIFPYAEDGECLKPNSELLVANIILAEVSAGKDCAAIADCAEKAAKARWMEFADDTKSELVGVINKELWDKQVADVVEFYSAWVFCNEGEYSAQRKKLMQLMAGRKAFRDFLPNHGLPCVHKSSLDGARESVLLSSDDKRNKDGTKHKEITSDQRRRFKLKKGEHLDAVGLVKRRARVRQADEENVSFPSVSRVAADPWLRGAFALCPNEFAAFKEAAGKLPKEILANVSYKAIQEDKAGKFPYEGTAVYINRYKDLQQEIEVDDAALKESLQCLNQTMQRLCSSLGDVAPWMKEPNPYLAVLIADGDKMGAALSKITTPTEHQEFSKNLSHFASNARTIVEKHRGVCIYTGGDDVMAFLPVDKALGCADELRNDFSEKMGDYGSGDEKLTLSVGIAIGHFLENLEDLRAFGKKAEHIAKGDDLPKEKQRNAVAVLVNTRGAEHISARGQWDEAELPIQDRLNILVRLFNEGVLSNRFPYELRQCAVHYRKWSGEILQQALVSDTLRLYAKKDKSPTKDSGDGRLFCEEYLKQRLLSHRDLDDFADEIMVAQHIAYATRQAAEQVKDGGDE